MTTRQTKEPDLSDARQHAEAVAYGRLLAVREILDALAKEKPDWRLFPKARGKAYIQGYDEAVRVVKAMRLGVERP